MIKQLLDIKLKGARSYVHSSDLYLTLDCVAKERFGPSAWLSSLSFRELIETRCQLILPEDGEVSALHGQATCTIEISGNTLAGLIVATGETITQRIPFDEALIERSADISQKKIIQRHRAGFTAIEEMVALTKYLHNIILPPEKGRWVFSGIDLKIPLPVEDDACFYVVLVQNLAGRMTISKIQQGDRDIGTIKFIVMS